MSSLSLEASIRTCKIDSGLANKVQSDRFLNPNNMVCVPWNGIDLQGRQVCADSFYTKTPGCNSAVDRVSVENAQRPQYCEYINLSAYGVDGSIYGNNMNYNNVGDNQQNVRNMNNVTGNYGSQFSAHTQIPCVGAYEMAEKQEENRLQSSNANAHEACMHGCAHY